jgi:hypothetical protein
LNGTGENSPLRAPIALPLAFRIRELSKNPSLFLTDPLVGGTIIPVRDHGVPVKGPLLTVRLLY